MKSFKQIAIVGTGPGHPDYMTQRALSYIKQADIVLYDCLVDEIILQVIPETTKKERVDKKFNKDNGMNIFDQEILKRMLQYLKEGLKVVRIKPGDSMNYNSGGMEADYLISRGYDVELVPGVPAHFAASNLLKLNLTEINQSNGFMSYMADEFEKENYLVPHIAYLMRYGNVPVCLYGMRVESFEKIQELFLQNGVSAEMPVAICCDVSLNTEQLIATNLAECADLVEVLANENKLPGHFVVIIGTYILRSYVD